MEETLIQAGLSRMQAKVYLHLLDKGASTPPEMAKMLKLTRSNAYKILDRLAELGLIRKEKAGKKFVYEAEDPALLAELVGEARNRAIAVEHATKAAMEVLRGRYAKQNSSLSTKKARGKDAVATLYEQQARLKKPIYYVKSHADVAYMGYETLDRLRRLPAALGSERYGITPDSAGAPASREIDKPTNLHRTWVDGEEYRSPVEWSTSGDELNIYVFDKETYALNIKSRVVAESFEELWKLLDKSLRLRPDYDELPKRAKREV